LAKQNWLTRLPVGRGATDERPFGADFDRMPMYLLDTSIVSLFDN
jgi:hypothetical protein